MKSETTTETTEQIFKSLPSTTQEELFTNFHILNSLDFAKYLHARPLIPDSLKAAFLAEKVSVKPAVAEDLLQQSLEVAVDKFWQRLGESR